MMFKILNFLNTNSFVLYTYKMELIPTLLLEREGLKKTIR